MGKVTLEGMEFFAYHGFHKEEQKIGNKYGVDVEVKTNLLNAAIHDDLSKTVDYTHLYNIIKVEMGIPAKLLENVAQRILMKIMREIPSVTHCKVDISKFNPPIGGVCYRSKITIDRSRQDFEQLMKDV
ncbi:MULTISPECIES: dihydroneopterin aldolase [Persicobacter]|uniref:7,8-dihydroneopterin aldolase n=1 Tax=Persicobacter diffluens TaxID=981 RepID=A0AAN5AI66_9BACT|nr:dihydroneopterin aldolase [Persicobacter sp. CCB-QB2]GJM60085.1 7,8-dihydroneopterin aldolase [Persicobacter diffluens]